MIFSALCYVSLVGSLLSPGGQNQIEFKGQSPDFYTLRCVSERLESDALKLSPLKFGPQNQPYAFAYLTTGLVSLSGKSDGDEPRFRIFSQEEAVANSLAPRASRMLLRLWDYNQARLRLDHKPGFGQRKVDVYLCQEGKAGGEQLFGEDLQAPKGLSTSVNTIYVYDMPTFTDKVEQVRELAHEYGHAALPSINGFRFPEQWANGFLGENLYLSWLLRDLFQKRITTSDVMDVDLKSLNAYVQRQITPLWVSASQAYPWPNDLVGEDKARMDKFLGWVLWVEHVLPERIFARSLKIMGTPKASDYPAAVLASLSGEESISVVLPDQVNGKNVWLPFANGTLWRKVNAGSAPTPASVLKRVGGWVLVRAGNTRLEFRPAN